MFEASEAFQELFSCPHIWEESDKIYGRTPSNPIASLVTNE
jgi:hypothetical protein